MLSVTPMSSALHFRSVTPLTPDIFNVSKAPREIRKLILLHFVTFHIPLALTEMDTS